MKTTDSKEVKRFQKVIDKYMAFVKETGDDFCLAEDADTYYKITDVKVWKTQVTFTTTYQDYWNSTYPEKVVDDWDMDEWTCKIQSDLRRGKRYFAMDSDRLDAITDGRIVDNEDDN